MRERPHLERAIQRLRARGGWDDVPDRVIAGTMVCAHVELALAVEDAGRAVRRSLPWPLKRLFPAPPEEP